MALVPTVCQKCFLISGSSGGSLYGATSRLCCPGGDQSLSSQEGHIWIQVEFKGVVEKFNITISGIGFHRCHSNHSVFVQRIKSSIVVLTVYVDDILLAGSDSAGLLDNKKYLKRYFVTKDMGRPKYFLRIKFAH